MHYDVPPIFLTLSLYNSQFIACFFKNTFHLCNSISNKYASNFLSLPQIIAIQFCCKVHMSYGFLIHQKKMPEEHNIGIQTWDNERSINYFYVSTQRTIFNMLTSKLISSLNRPSKIGYANKNDWYSQKINCIQGTERLLTGLVSKPWTEHSKWLFYSFVKREL